MGRVIIIANRQPQTVYEGLPGMTFVGNGIAELRPDDGPFQLEQWGCGEAIVFDGGPGDLPDVDPTAEHLKHPCLYGTMPDGRTIFTAPLLEVTRQGLQYFAYVVDGLTFELSTPDQEWLNASSDPRVELSRFFEEFAPMELQAQSGGVQ
jgi:hypothetical protein